MNQEKLKKLSQLIRYYILTSTTKAGSGHPTSSLSATDLMCGLMFGGFFKYDLNNPKNPNNDRLIFSKGHAAPLFYALWLAAGKVSEKELLRLRKFNSPLEGHPAMAFPYTEAATGSLGQGLSVGLGMALNAKYLDRLPYKTYVLLGDSEMAEGAVWEAIQLASHYKLDNLVGIIDVNRLGQTGATMYGHNVKAYQKRISAFGWKTIVIDGHNWNQILTAFKQTQKSVGKPVMIIAKTIKGKGVSFLENKNGWHGRALDDNQLKKALVELNLKDTRIRGTVKKPTSQQPKKLIVKKAKIAPFSSKEEIATRKAYGLALARILPKFPNLVALDAEVSNSTCSADFAKIYPKHFFEMYIVEQNMVGAAVGLSRLGKIPFVSTFAAFFTRAFDQIRMSQYSDSNIKFVGSHAGVSIGEDGASQMGLEDIAMFRSLLDSVVLYPSDAVSADKLIEQAARHKGLVYIRTTRAKTPVVYKRSEKFPIGGSKTLLKSNKDRATIVAAGITLHQAIKAATELASQKILVRVIDLYSIKPLDRAALLKAARETKKIITVEDHFSEGGLGEAVKSALADTKVVVKSLAVTKMPKSGKPEQLLDYEGISSQAIVREVKKII